MSYSSSTEANCVYSEDIKKDEEYNFDLILKEKWMEAQKNGVFRYILNIQDSKILESKYHFLVQLNINRGYKRRFAENIILMNQPLNEKNCNFTKFTEEQVMNLNNTDKDDIIAINASPIEYCHSLLLPQRCKQLLQLVTKHSLLKAVELFSLSLSLYLRVAFNSLCALASVNHLHWHLYYLRWRMLLEYIVTTFLFCYSLYIYPTSPVVLLTIENQNLFKVRDYFQQYTIRSGIIVKISLFSYLLAYIWGLSGDRRKYCVVGD